MGIGSSKEGSSVFGSLNCCVSPVGRRLLRTWFLRPIIDLKVWRQIVPFCTHALLVARFQWRFS
jgi:MutS domain III